MEGEHFNVGGYDKDTILHPTLGTSGERSGSCMSYQRRMMQETAEGADYHVSTWIR